MRVSEKQRFNVVNNRVAKAKGDNESLLKTLSTQKKINRLSDDPASYANIIKFNKSVNDLNQYVRNIEFSVGYLERAESAITTLNDNLIRAKELAIAMSNDTNSGQNRQMVAAEVKEIINEVKLIANTQFAGRYIFSGMRTNTPAVDHDGNYVGDEGQIYIPVNRGVFKPINISGRELFESKKSMDGSVKTDAGMIRSLEMLYDGLMNNAKDLVHRGNNEISKQIDKVTSYHATIGATISSLDKTKQNHDLSIERNTAMKSNLEDADIFKATSDFKRTEAVLQSTLLASSKILQPSLLNFLQ